MRVLILNTSETSGGAAIAASRLTDALNHHGVKAKLLVRDKQTDRVTTCTIPQRWRLRAAFLWERLRVWAANRFHREGLWAVDIACAGADITRLSEFHEADIIHLHWINQGLLSMRQLEKILHSGKPVVWTMHDQWPYTAICHHARECERYQTHCHDCPQLTFPRAKDLSWQVYKKKIRAYAQGNITFVGCSQWIAEQARKSRLLANKPVWVIPNPYPTAIFHPADAVDARRRHRLPMQGHLLLFACQKVTNPRKGLALLLQALNYPQLLSYQGRLALVVVGQMAKAVAAHLPFPLHTIDYVSDAGQMAALYQAVDLFVTPSLEENLPNTIMEAMACGTPCVGFHIGGIPEMIDHKENGYVARYHDAEDLANGIAYALDPQHHDRLAQAATQKAKATWNEEVVAHRYLQLYEANFEL